MGRPGLLAIALVALLAPSTALATPMPPLEPALGSGEWWTVSLRDLAHDQHFNVTYVVVAKGPGFLDVALRAADVSPYVFALPAFPLGRVTLPQFAFEAGDAPFQAANDTLTVGSTWRTQWQSKPLVASVTGVKGTEVTIEFRETGNHFFSRLVYDADAQRVVSHYIKGVAHAQVTASGPTSDCDAFLPTRIDGLALEPIAPTQAIVDSGTPGAVWRRVDIGERYDHVAWLMMARASGQPSTAHVLLVAPDGETYETAAGPGEPGVTRREGRLVHDPHGQWRTGTTEAEGGRATIQAYGIAHRMILAQDGAGCRLLALEEWDDDLHFAGQSTFSAPPGALLAALTFGTAAAAGLLVWAGRRLRDLPFLPLFVKLSRHQVEHQSVRTAILEALQQQPGLTTQELRKELGLAWGATVHHLRVLERHHLAGSVNWGRNRHWFHQRFPLRDRALSAALRHQAARRILEAVWQRPGREQELVAQDVGLHRATVIFHARKLASLRLIDRRREAGNVRYFPLQPMPGRASALAVPAISVERLANPGPS